MESCCSCTVLDIPGCLCKALSPTPVYETRTSSIDLPEGENEMGIKEDLAGNNFCFSVFYDVSEKGSSGGLQSEEVLEKCSNNGENISVTP